VGARDVDFVIPRKVCPPTNHHHKTNSTNLELKFTLTETPKRGFMSIYSTDLYQGVIMSIFGNRSMGRIVRAGGLPSHFFFIILKPGDD